MPTKNDVPTPLLYGLPVPLVLHVPGAGEAGVIPAEKWSVQVLDGVPHQVFITKVPTGEQFIAAVPLPRVGQLRPVRVAGQDGAPPKDGDTASDAKPSKGSQKIRKVG